MHSRLLPSTLPPCPVHPSSAVPASSYSARDSVLQISICHCVQHQLRALHRPNCHCAAATAFGGRLSDSSSLSISVYISVNTSAYVSIYISVNSCLGLSVRMSVRLSVSLC